MMTRRLTRGRPGTIIPILAISMVGLFAFVALAIDLGLLTVARTECQDAADASALAGARLLDNKPGSVENNKVNAIAASKNTVKENFLWSEKFKDAHISDVSPRVYRYKDHDNNSSTPPQFVAETTAPGAGESWSGMHVLIETTQTTFFAKVFGVTSMQTGARALAVHRPRDIAFVLDFSGSMRFSSTHAWPYSDNHTTYPLEGVLNPDPVYPKFGHYGRFVHYQTDTPDASLSASTDPTERPNPFQMKTGFVDPVDGYGFAPNNHTMHSVGGPPMVWDYKTAPGNPAAGSVDPTTLTNAFKMWDPPVTTPFDTTNLTPEGYNFTGYNALTAACPAPKNFEDQSDTPIPYVGDKWPRASGKRGFDSTQAWATLSSGTLTENGAKTAAEFLGSALSATNAGRSLAAADFNFPTDTGYAHPDPTRRDGGQGWGSYRDAIWEAYGYDMDVADLRSQTAPGTKVVRLLADKFKGYSMGPMYWGKTFFVWPPDPRWGGGSSGNPNPASPATTGAFAGVKDTNGHWICDWRKRFFLNGNGSAFTDSDNINYILFRSGSGGHLLNQPNLSAGAGQPGYYQLNYPAILAWLKSGPQTLPGNVRAGRVLYYASIPTNADGTSDMDKRFWREYIHYLFGIGTWNTSTLPINDGNGSFTPAYNPDQMLAGTERNFPFGTVSVSSTAPTQFDPNGSTTAPPINPRPYMNYTDNVNRPRMHFWFGPQTLLQFMTSYRSLTKPLTSGTVREAQCWQLKAAINSVLDDVRINHPNDYCGMAFFCNRTGDAFYTPRAPMGQDWYRLKNCLFYRKDMLDILAALPANQRDTAPNEERPYNSSFNKAHDDMPNADGGTDPNSGLAVAYNLLSDAPSLSSTHYPTKGRKGAAKIVIFETDGVPNARGSFRHTAAGADSRYVDGTPQSWTTDTNALLSTAAKAALEVIRRTTLPAVSSGTSGHSLPNSPARVYPIAFGDLFAGYNGTNYGSQSDDTKAALYFLTRAAQLGNTLPLYSSGTTMYNVGSGGSEKILPYDQVITGPYQRPNPNLPISATNPAGRIEKLRDTLERIMQSGVQVTLIE